MHIYKSKYTMGKFVESMNVKKGRVYIDTTVL